MQQEVQTIVRINQQSVRFGERKASLQLHHDAVYHTAAGSSADGNVQTLADVSECERFVR